MTSLFGWLFLLCPFSQHDGAPTPMCGTHPAGGNYKLRATPPLPRSRWRHTCHKFLVTDSAFGARGDLVYSGEAVEATGLRSLLRLSSAGERSLHTGEVVGSIPTAPTISAMKRQRNVTVLSISVALCRLITRPRASSPSHARTLTPCLPCY